MSKNKRPANKMDMRAISSQFRGLSSDVGIWPALPKILLMIAIVVAIGVASYYAFWEGQLNEIKSKRDEELRLRSEFIEKKQQAVTLEARREQLAEIERTFGALLKRLPNKSQVEALLSEVNQAGLGHGLQFELFKPQPEKKQQYYAEFPVTVRLSGFYHDFGLFANDVAQLSRIVTVTNMEIKMPTGTQSNTIVKDGPKEGMLTMDAVVKTYYYLDPSEAEGGGASPAGGQ